MKFFAWMAVVVSLLGGSVMAEDWPQFRGGAALSQAPFAKVPLAWDAAKNVAWRTTVPGAGWSQPVVSGDRIFLTTAVAPSGGRPSGMMGGVMSLSTWGMGSAGRRRIA